MALAQKQFKAIAKIDLKFISSHVKISILLCRLRYRNKMGFVCHELSRRYMIDCIRHAWIGTHALYYKTVDYKLILLTAQKRHLLCW